MSVSVTLDLRLPLPGYGGTNIHARDEAVLFVHSYRDHDGRRAVVLVVELDQGLDKEKKRLHVPALSPAEAQQLAQLLVLAAGGSR